jgi:hypothetical protein
MQSQVYKNKIHIKASVWSTSGDGGQVNSPALAIFLYFPNPLQALSIFESGGGEVWQVPGAIRRHL